MSSGPQSETASLEGEVETYRPLYRWLGASDVTNVTKSRDAMLHNLLDVLGFQRILALIEDPPKLTGKPLPADWPTMHVPKETGSGSSSAAAAPLHQSFATKFGTQWQQVTGEELEPVPPPPWLNDALDFMSETGELLVGQKILYYFGPDEENEEGCWAVGEIVCQLEDQEDTVEVVDPPQLQRLIRRRRGQPSPRARRLRQEG